MEYPYYIYSYLHHTIKKNAKLRRTVNSVPFQDDKSFDSVTQKSDLYSFEFIDSNNNEIFDNERSNLLKLINLLDTDMNTQQLIICNPTPAPTNDPTPSSPAPTTSPTDFPSKTPTEYPSMFTIYSFILIHQSPNPITATATSPDPTTANPTTSTPTTPSPIEISTSCTL